MSPLGGRAHSRAQAASVFTSWMVAGGEKLGPLVESDAPGDQVLLLDQQLARPGGQLGRDPDLAALRASLTDN
ncbi:hypothetical protein [Pseudofrankia sp. DC12]|uniref:hypothetical protein n=1 Tax=Pseudofrankia sp. DC12 TaxID=683315 RepID=UPI0012FC707B|nr:hypothetical protein [Pseudofrankia sp. DC12]